MNDELLRLYNAELAFLRRMGGEFAEAYPAVASNLGLNAAGETDPFVARMIESFAFLSARTRMRIEDDFPEICGSMLEVLYPHYQRPIPSTFILQCELPPEESDAAPGHRVPRGKALRTEAVEDVPCQYRTCYDVDCWPIRIAEVRHEGQPLRSPQTKFSNQAAAGLCIRLAATGPKTALKDLPLDSLRFFIRAQPPFSYELYENLFRRLIGVAVIDVHSAGGHELLRADAVRPVGFGEAESLYPYPQRSFDGYRILSEYFAFPQKHLFFDVCFGDALRRRSAAEVELYFYFNHYRDALDLQIRRDSLLLGCTPAVNLYQLRAEQIRLDHRKAEYPLVIDSRRPHAHEVYSLDDVSGVDARREKRTFAPFYSIRHERDDRRTPVLWHAKRSTRRTSPLTPHGGTDLALSFVDLDFDPLDLNDWAVDVVVTCVNRDLPALLPFGVGRPALEFEGGDLAIPRCITPPTPTRRPQLERRLRWKLLSHLSLNHLSLCSESGGAEALREILRLYDFRDSTESRRMIEGIVQAATFPTVRRVTGPHGSVPCRGIEVELHLDPASFSDGSLFLFASVLDRFLAHYSHVNSFTQTKLHDGAETSDIHRWPPRTGARQLL